MQKTKEGFRCTIRFSNKDYNQKEILQMFEYLLSTGEYATESDIFREGIKSLYREKIELDALIDWDTRIQECAVVTADVLMERLEKLLSGVAIVEATATESVTEVHTDELETIREGMKPPEATEELDEGVGDFLSSLYGDM